MFEQTLFGMMNANPTRLGNSRIENPEKAKPRFRQMLTVEKHLDLTRLNGYVAQESITALASTLIVNIVIPLVC